MPTSTTVRPRNTVAMSPLLRKGGVHERSKSGIRANAKHEMQDQIVNWREVLEEECISTTNHPRTGSEGELFEVDYSLLSTSRFRIPFIIFSDLP